MPGASPTEQAQPDGWQRHVQALRDAGLLMPGEAVQGLHAATTADEQALYDVAPSFVSLLPWVEFLPESQCMLLEDGQSVAAFFELRPLGTEGREAAWLAQARDALENALQDSFDELDENPWVVQLYAQDEASFDHYLDALRHYIQPRAQGSRFSEFYLKFFAHHLRAVAKPGGRGNPSALARPKPACAYGGVPPRDGPKQSARPNARTDPQHSVRSPDRWSEQRRHSGAPVGCARNSRLAAALVQPPSHNVGF